MVTTRKITACLWFADAAEDAAKFYIGIFKHSKITATTRYGAAGFDAHHRPPGSVMTIAFELTGGVASHGSDAWDEEDRHRRASPGARRARIVTFLEARMQESRALVV